MGIDGVNGINGINGMNKKRDSLKGFFMSQKMDVVLKKIKGAFRGVFKGAFNGIQRVFLKKDHS